MLTNKLCNPTHKLVKFQYDRGVNIKIEPDSTIDITMEQLNDFREGQPGSEEARQVLEYYGVFLLDGDRSFDEQALSSLRNTQKAKKGQLEAFIQRLRDLRIAAGSPVDESAMEEAKERAGYKVMEDDLDKISKRISILEKVVTSEGHRGRVREDLDPKRTCFACQPPREFPSETALELFLSDKDSSFVAQHKELQKAMLGDE